MELMSLNLFLMQKYALHTINFLNDKNYWQTSCWIRTRISTTSVKIIFTQVPWSIQSRCQKVQCFTKTCSNWRFSNLWDHYLYTGLGMVYSLVHNHDNMHIVGASDLQGMLTRPRPLTLKARVCSALNLYFA